MKLLELPQKLINSHAVLFENIKESDFRLISNLVGTRKRFALAVGGTENNIHQKVISAIKNAKKPKIVSNRKIYGKQVQKIYLFHAYCHSF